jgi:hypothetical protein
LLTRLTDATMSDMAGVDVTDEKRVSIRLSAEDLTRVKALALGDETLSQTVRRVLREASHTTAIMKRVRRK